MKKVVIIGGGVIGCSIARELSRYNCDITLLEKANDVACGTSKANSGIVHAGFDAKPNTLKAKFNILGNAMFDDLSQQLDFPFRRNGALVLCFDKDNLPQLEMLYEKGIANGVSELELCDQNRVKELNPYLSDKVVGCLYAKTSGIVGPYEMTIAYAENAYNNGVKFEFEKKVINIQSNDSNWTISCEDNSQYIADIVINCAGVYADEINNFVNDTKLEIIPRKGEYVLMDKSEGYITSMTLFQLPTKMGKGILVTPSCHGNLIVGPTAMDIEDKTNVNTTFDGLNEVFSKGSITIPTLNRRNIIKQFSGLRAHSVTDDFVIGWANSGFFNVAGIESPGLTSAPAIATYVAKEVSSKYEMEKNSSFDPIRKGIPCFAHMTDSERKALIAKNPLYGKVVCRCELVTEGEIVDSINRPIGAKDIDGVKRRTRAGMGRCQSGFCTARTMEILARELNVPMEDVTLCGKGSNIVVGRAKE